MMMDENVFTKPISRREMMKRTAIAAGALALLPTLSACEGDMNVETLGLQIRQTGKVATGEKQAAMMELVRLSSLAASGHNMQPWIFEVSDDSISILPDYSRKLMVVDPQYREFWMSLGCALENLVIAAHGASYDVEESPMAGDEERLTVRLSEGGAVSEAALADAISRRQCNRSAYNMEFVSKTDMEILQSMTVKNDATALFVQDGTDVKKLQALVMEGDRQQYADEAFVAELVESLRFNEREALETRDGLFSACSGNPKVPRFIGKMFVNTGMGEKQAETDAQMIDSSSGMILITTIGDSKSDWVNAGRLYQRMALQMTILGMAHGFLNQPIEVPALREEVKMFVEGGVANNPWREDKFRVPQLLLRYGYAEPMPYSLRRSLDEVIQQG